VNDIHTHMAAATDLDDLRSRLLAIGSDPATGHHLDQALSELPTFGGTMPADTQEVWSWDADRLLVGNEFEIVARADW
jgi:hypothetical protein